LKDNKDRWIQVEAAEKRSGVEISVADAGSGIDESLAEKIMTPFFTTKKDTKGTGIGLSLSRSIARRHGGDLILDRENNHTSVVLNLPKLACPF
jgi:two-component system CheB/CheR fusion protein